MPVAGRQRREKGVVLSFKWQASVLVVAACLDFVVGDPWGWLHPVQVMGWVISWYSDRMIRWSPSPATMKLAGVGLAILLIGGTFGVSAVGLSLLARLSPILRWVCECVLLASCFAGRSLRQAAADVLHPLSQAEPSSEETESPESKDYGSANNDLEDHSPEGRSSEEYSATANNLAAERKQKASRKVSESALEQARERLALYVGRDTAQLSAKEVRRAVLETVSENAIDGVLAPLFYAILGAIVGWAAPMALTYKAASTLDSMVGYREAPYTDLGWFSAQFEDALTWLPCRFSVVMIALISGRPRQVLRLCWRDAREDPSPNAGWSECAYAAALGVQLGGTNTYRGKVKVKPTLGDDTRPITNSAIVHALRLTRWSFLVGLLTGIGIFLSVFQSSTPYFSYFSKLFEALGRLQLGVVITFLF